MTTILETTIGTRVYRVRDYGAKHGCEVIYQPINPKTGKPWQACQRVEWFTGENAKKSAAFCYLRATRDYRKSLAA